MLSGIKLVDRGEAERLRRRDKKEKKKHKHKEKKAKHKRRDDSCDGGGGGSSDDGCGGKLGRRGRLREQWDDPSSADDSGSEGEEGGGGGGAAPSGGGAEREDWMTKPMVRPKTDAQLAREEEEREEALQGKRRDPDKPFVSERELNPYLKDGGSGVPPQGAAAPPAPRATGVGDGGASWRLKALKRAQQLAGEEGKKVNEIVAERWGSLAELTAGLTEGRRAAHGMAHVHSARDRRRADPEFEQRQAERRRMREGGEAGEEGGERGGGGEKAAYLADMQSGRSQMRRPQEGASLSWRRPDSRGGQGRESREGEHGRGGQRDRCEGDRREGNRREGGRYGDRGRGRGDDSRDRHDRRDERPPRARRDPLGREGDAAALKAAAAELNQFEGDGSFLEQFQRQQAAAADGSAPEEQQQRGGALDGGERRVGHEPRPDAGTEVVPSDSSTSGEEDEEAARQREREEMLAERQGRPPVSSPTAAMAAERAALAARAAGGGGGAASGGADGLGGGDSGGGGGSARQPKAGNLSAAAALRARLTGKAPPPAAEPEAERARRETVVLPLVDARGKAVPGAFGRDEASARLPDMGGRGTKRVQRYEGGERDKYFADDHGTDLQTLIKRTKHGDEGDVDARLAAGIMRSQKYKQADFDADAEYDHDAGLEHLDRGTRRGAAEKAAARDKQRQIKEYSRHASALESCRLCFASANRPRQLTIAIGQSAYLALPARGRLVPGHCCIVPAEHVASTRQVDEQVWTEIRNFKKCLIQMFMKQGKEVVFLETAMHLGSMRSHAVVECVPVPPAAAVKAPMYFKKAVDDATSEWAQHHAKRFIDTRAKGLRGSIPPNFPYLHVEFGISDGFVHVIDDESKFDPALARSVLIGLLGLPQEDMHRKARQESSGIQQQWATEFRRQFEPYDWTKMLEA